MPSDPAHNLGPACRLAPVTPPAPDGALEGIPPLKAHFFYSSPIPLDDPFSTATIVGAADSKSHRTPLRPFSPGDNNALENAWLALGSDSCRKNHANARRDRSPSPSLSHENAAKLEGIMHRLVAKHRIKHEREGQDATLIRDTPAVLPDSTVPVCCSELLIDAPAELRNEFCALVRKRQRALDHDIVIQGVMSRLGQSWLNAMPTETSQAAGDAPSSIAAQKTYAEGRNDRSRAASVAVPGANPSLAPLPSVEAAKAAQIRPPIHDDGISGMPFVRVGEETTPQGCPMGSLPNSSSVAWERSPPTVVSSEDGQSLQNTQLGHDAHTGSRVSPVVEESKDIPVGVSRLHKVSLPILQLKPIYWSPVNDISIVIRSTWFYRDGMVPVEPAVANQLESGYRELRAWSETWADELSSALEVGALGEEKVSHPLWQETVDRRSKGKESPPPEPPISSDPFCAARCYQGEAAAAGTLEAVQPGDDPAAEARPYKNYHVIYKDGHSAYLLKQSLRPSAYYGRKPVAKIMKGVTVGVPVVRGFDWHAWERLHGKKHAGGQTIGPAMAPSARSPVPQVCPGCDSEQERGQVTDLVLVAHGIGQKFAERVESFHFTHAINAFRRAVNVELGNEAVRSVLRPAQNGIMVLPLNWRHVLKFEEGGPMREEDKATHSAEDFTLKDIEPRTIPAVRSIISDVMFDIPFYMSHHKPKMIAALVAEANRVYRLWCQNNPGFSDKGRVHVVAHSLGSVMALEILSKQPTTIPRLDLKRGLPLSDRFEFDTKNLFLLGSPAGFFLLLERGNLIPRRGRFKPGADRGDATDEDVVGETGKFGCLAVDNIYNILAREDPIAYLLNGTIDPNYASSLKTAYVPSSATTLLQSIGNAMRGLAGSAAVPSPAPDTTPQKPPTARLPSQLELEVHDFTREDIAEKKAYLLNENGQIDYYLRSGGGPLEIQYLNMLSAHSSYWYNSDLIRMLCIEVGRQPGRKSTLPSMRAVKAAKQPLLSNRSGR
ncbi:DDHD domain-containing protein [Coniochaeta sp. 2T2.1]|nr:DDHD domain-containing protein [Coniochaeta sp. 2T2.1]